MEIGLLLVWLGEILLALGVGVGLPGQVTAGIERGMRESLDGTPFESREVRWAFDPARVPEWGRLGDLSGVLAMRLPDGRTGQSVVTWHLDRLAIEPASFLPGHAIELAHPARARVHLVLESAELAEVAAERLPGLMEGLTPLPGGGVPVVRLKELEFRDGRIVMGMSVKAGFFPVALPVRASVEPRIRGGSHLVLADLSVQAMGQDLANRLPVPRDFDLAGVLPPWAEHLELSGLDVREGRLSLDVGLDLVDLPTGVRPTTGLDSPSVPASVSLRP